MMTSSSIISSGLITVNQWFEHSQNTAMGDVESLRMSAWRQRMALLLEWEWQGGKPAALAALQSGSAFGVHALGVSCTPALV